jgi:hypothetical protein
MGLFDFLKKNNQKEKTVGAIDEFTQQMIDTSSKCVDRFQGRFIGLNFSVESLKVVDNILEEVSEFKEDMNEGQINNVIQTVGSYIFEVARKNFGGRYFWYDQLNQPILVTGQPNFEISLLAFEKVKGRIQNGKEDNIPFFFQGYVERVNKAKPGDKAMIV